MPLIRITLVCLSALVLAGCASTNADLVPLPSTEGMYTVSEDGSTKLQVQVQNQGVLPTDSSPVAVVFLLRTRTVTTALQDGGPLKPGDSSGTLEFDIPELCIEGGCEFRVSVDPKKQIEAEHRSNNVASGRLVGQQTTVYVPTLGSLEPRPRQ